MGARYCWRYTHAQMVSAEARLRKLAPNSDSSANLPSQNISISGANADRELNAVAFSPSSN